jgi:hypothetical protein
MDILSYRFKSTAVFHFLEKRERERERERERGKKDSFEVGVSTI